MKTCSLCGKEIREGDQFCTACGNPYEVENLYVDAQVGASEVPQRPAVELGASEVAQPEQEREPQQPQAAEPTAFPSEMYATAPTAANPVSSASALYRTRTAYGQAPVPPSYGGATQSAPHPVQPQSGAMYTGASSPVQPPMGTMYTNTPPPAQPPTGTMYTSAPPVQPPMPPQMGSMYRSAPAAAYYPQETVSLGEWLVHFLVMLCPIVNIVMLCVWGFGNSAKISVRNWARASLIWMGIALVLGVLFIVFIFATFASIASYGYYGY